MLDGAWRAGECRIDLGAGDEAGPALASGACPGRIGEAGRWRLEPDERYRIDLLTPGGETVWSGLMTGPDQLTGFAPGAGGAAFARDGAPASTDAPGPH
ncbi:MAG: hypothetical protein JJU18_08070 [Oceanicaulis sp.]|nr:hypothetical protein [Oceanicaulis sp.]